MGTAQHDTVYRCHNYGVCFLLILKRIYDSQELIYIK